VISLNKQSKKPKISIGMPVYNGAMFLREALDSLLAQTYENFEIIISDNASNDDTGSICQEYSVLDARIRFVRQENNKGALENFKFVLQKAEGEYFMWAAADDWWSNNWLEENLVQIQKKGVVSSFGKSVRTKADLTDNGPIQSYRFLSESRMLRLIHFFMTDENTKGNLFYGLVKTEFMKNFGIHKSKSSYGTEYPHLFKLVSYGKIACAENTLLKKRNTIRGIRRYGNKFSELLIQYALSFRQVLNKDRFIYYREFIELTPGNFGKAAIMFLIPIKIVISIYYEYVRGLQLGLEIIKEKYLTPQ
jgi:glycosyltransferase involved in cell wall biosynthesis